VISFLPAKNKSNGINAPFFTTPPPPQPPQQQPFWPSQGQILYNKKKQDNFTLHLKVKLSKKEEDKMGLCASKDKKEKVIEGDGAATANGEPNGGTATAASPDAAAAQEGCVYMYICVCVCTQWGLS